MPHTHALVWAGAAEPSNRCAVRLVQFTQNFPPNFNPREFNHPANSSFRSSPPSTATMSHESVWNSRPRSYGKGSRSWYDFFHISLHEIPPQDDEGEHLE